MLSSSFPLKDRVRNKRCLKTQEGEIKGETVSLIILIQSLNLKQQHQKT